MTWKQIENALDRNVPVYLVDLRSEKAYQKIHIKGAYNIPMDEEGVWIQKIDSGKQPVFYCDRGGRSMRACFMMQKAGIAAAQIAGGILAYHGKYLEEDAKVH